MAKQQTNNLRIISKNRKALHNYEVEEKLEAGIVLQGTEVKSLRAGKLNLSDAYAEFQGNELFLIHAHISPYSHGTHDNHSPQRPRKLLLKRNELERLQSKVVLAGMTLIPLAVYFSGSLVKVELGVCRGKKLHDKRQALKEKQTKREMDRAIADAKRS